MSIKSNIEAVMEQIRNGDNALAEDVQAKAVSAIKKGEASPEWEAYMSLFSQSPTELARLMPTDSTLGNFEMDVARTYLVGNGTCGADTTGFHLIQGVEDKLDEGLS